MAVHRRVFQLLAESNNGSKVPIGTAFQCQEGLLTATHAVEQMNKARSAKLSVRAYDGGRQSSHRDVPVQVEGTRKGDLAVLSVKWPDDLPTEKFQVGYPPATQMSLGLEVMVPGFPDLQGGGQNRLRAIRSWIQCSYEKDALTHYELPHPAFGGLSGSPVLFHDWGVSNGLDYAIGMVVEGVAHEQEDGHGNKAGVAYWAKAVDLREALLGS